MSDLDAARRRRSPAARPTGTGSAAGRRWTSSTPGASAGGATSSCLVSGDDWSRGCAAPACSPHRPRAPPRLLARGARAARGDRRRRARRRRRRAAADARTSRLIDDWLALAGARPALRSGPDGLPRLGERAGEPTRRGARSGTVALDAARMLGDAARARARAHLRVGRPARRASTTARRPAAGAGARWRGAATPAKARRHRARVTSRAGEHSHDRRSPVRPRGRRRLRHRDRRARPRRAARCATAASTSRTSSATCRSRRSGACSSTARFEPGLPPAEPHPLASAPATRASTCRRRWRCSAPEWGFRQLIDISDEQARDDLARASVMALSFVAQSARGAGRPPVPQREIDKATLDPRALPDPLARRGRPRPREGDRRLLDLRRRARHERVDVHGARRRLHRRRRARPRSRAPVGALSGPLHGGAPRAC